VGDPPVYDMQDDLAADGSVNGTFSTPVFAARAEAIIAAQSALALRGQGVTPRERILSF
jgi:hypothetical protein